MRLRHYPCMIGAVSLIALMAASAQAEERYYFRSAPEAGTLSLDAPGVGTNTVTANRFAARSQGISETPSAGDSALGAFVATE